MGRKGSARERLLIAATKVVSEVGAGNLTLDRVAIAAGVSKGGLLYHFATKRDLIEAMMTEVLGEFQTKLFEKADVSEDKENPQLVAAIKVMQERTEVEKLRMQAILAASAENPDLLEPAQTVLKEHFDEVKSKASNKNQTLTILMALEGIRFMELCNLLPLDSEEVNGLLEELLDLCPTK